MAGQVVNSYQWNPSAGLGRPGDESPPDHKAKRKDRLAKKAKKKSRKQKKPKPRSQPSTVQSEAQAEPSGPLIEKHPLHVRKKKVKRRKKHVPTAATPRMFLSELLRARGQSEKKSPGEKASRS